MKNVQLESYIEKFLFLNFNNGYDAEESLTEYLEFTDMKQIIEDKDYIIRYISTKSLSNRRKEILILNCVKYNFASNKTTPIKWLEEWLLFRINCYIDKI